MNKNQINLNDICMFVIKKHPIATKLMTQHCQEHNHIMNHDLNHNVYDCNIHECCIQAKKEQMSHDIYKNFHAKKTAGKNAPIVFKYYFP
jgi:hypothetical protein